MMLRNVVMVGVAVTCNVLAQFFLKMASKGMVSSGSAAWRYLIQNVYVWAGLISYGISFALSILIYKAFDLSVISPIMMALIFIVLLIISNIFLGEPITVKKCWGMASILVGIVLLAKT